MDMDKISIYEEAYNYGVRITRRKVAKKLLEDDYTIAMISEVTSLCVEEIMKGLIVIDLFFTH